MRRARPALLAFLLALATGGGLTLAPVASPVQIAGIKEFAATIDVAGRYVITRRFDSTRTCGPGRRYDLVHTVDLELGRPRAIRVTTSPRFVGSTEGRSRGVGEARTTTEIEHLSKTNFCAPDPEVPVPDPGPCGQAEGDMSAAIAGVPVPGRKGVPVVLAVTRVNGGSLKLGVDGCELPVAGSDPEVRPALGLSVLPTRTTGLTVPLGIDGATLRKLKAGRSLARRVTFSGLCEAATGKGAKARAIGPDGQVVRDRCRVKGHVWVRIARDR